MKNEKRNKFKLKHCLACGGTAKISVGKTKVVITCQQCKFTCLVNSKTDEGLRFWQKAAMTKLAKYWNKNNTSNGDVLVSGE